MMMPSLTPSSSSSSYSSSSSATVRVEKATSEFLIGPDWTLNMDICDTINYNQPLAKDVVKAVKKRLQHKNPKVQLFALTLLEAMVKNCGDYVHFQIAERNILQEMIKIVKKKADMHVRDKILTLLDSWQEAFGGPGGKYPQYYWAYDELRRSGVEFPQRSHDTAPIFTPPVTHPTPRQPQPGYGMPNNSSIRLDEAMATETENLSLSSLNSMRDVADLLADMLQAVNPSDRLAVKDEVIVDLVEQCRANQKKLMQSLATTGDEELLAQGLELNDNLQSLLAKHDAIASGSPLPVLVPHVTPQSSEKHDTSLKPDEARKPSRTPNPAPSAPVLAENRGKVDEDEDEDEDEEDDFAQLARRHSKAHTSGSQSTSVGFSEGLTSVNAQNSSLPGSSSTPIMNNALVLADPPAPVRTTKEQDIVELLSLSLSTDTSSPRTPQTSAPSMQNMNHMPVSSTGMGNPYNSQAHLGNQSQVFNSYVAPWAQPLAQQQPQAQQQFQPQAQHQFQPQAQSPAQPQYQFQPQPQHQFQPQAQPPAQPQDQFQPQGQPRPQPQHQFQPEARLQPQYQPQPQPQQLVVSSVQPQPQRQQQYLHDTSAYPPPPWAPTPGYLSNTSTSYRAYAHSTPQTTATSSIPPQAAKSVQHVNSFPVRGSNGSVVNGDVQSTSTTTTGQKPFIPSYKLFEDLNVLGNIDGRPKVTSTPSPSLSEARSQNMFGQRK